MKRLVIVAVAAGIGLSGCDGRGTGLRGVTPTVLPAAKLTILSQPSNAIANQNIAPAIQVAVQTANNVTVPTSTASITVTLTAGTGTAGAILTGVSPATASAGIAIFNNLRIDRAGTYSLTFTSPGLTPVVSNTFDVAP
jgi:hypothetical protein